MKKLLIVLSSAVLICSLSYAGGRRHTNITGSLYPGGTVCGASCDNTINLFHQGYTETFEKGEGEFCTSGWYADGQGTYEISTYVDNTYHLCGHSAMVWQQADDSGGSLQQDLYADGSKQFRLRFYYKFIPIESLSTGEAVPIVSWFSGDAVQSLYLVYDSIDNTYAATTGESGLFPTVSPYTDTMDLSPDTWYRVEISWDSDSTRPMFPSVCADPPSEDTCDTYPVYAGIVRIYLQSTEAEITGSPQLYIIREYQYYEEPPVWVNDDIYGDSILYIGLGNGPYLTGEVERSVQMYYDDVLYDKGLNSNPLGAAE